jgi:hypothetical protein
MRRVLVSGIPFFVATETQSPQGNIEEAALGSGKNFGLFDDVGFIKNH